MANSKTRKAAAALIFSTPLAALAENEQLPTLIVEGNTMRPGTFGVAPDSSGLKDTASLLKRIPGANVNRNGPLTGIAQYRGLYGDRINAEVDGFSWKTVGPNSMDPPLSHVPAALTESFQVFRGIAPVSSGVETIGGSMKVESRKGEFAAGDNIEFHGVAASGYSMVDNGNYATLFTSVANQNHRLHASGSTEEGNSYKFENDKAVRPTQYDREAYTVGYGYQRAGHGFDINYSDNSTGHSGTPALPMDIIYVRGGVTNFDYHGDFGDGYRLDGRFNYQNMRHWMDNYTLRDVPTNRITGMDMFRQQRTEVDGFDTGLAFSLPLFSGNLKSGVDVDQSHHDAVISDPTNGMFFVDNFNGVKRDRYSIFTEWRGDLAEQWNLELGLRYTHVRSRADKVATSLVNLPNMVGANARILRDAFNASDRKIGDDNIDLAAVLRYAFSDSLDFELGVARKTRSPSYQELFLWLPLEATGGLADNRVYIGDVNLNHEVAYQFELGLEWHTDQVYFAPRIFYHHVEDYIQGDLSTNQAANTVATLLTGSPALQFTNIDARLYGFDVEMGYSFTDSLRFDSTVSYVRGRRTDHGDNLYRIAPLNGRGQLTFERSNWMVSMEGVFATAQNDVADFNREVKTPGYALLNLRGQYEPVRGLTLGLGVENVMDKKHFDHLSGYNRARGNSDLAVDNVNGDRVRLPGQGRNYYATVSYSW